MDLLNGIRTHGLRRSYLHLNLYSAVYIIILNLCFIPFTGKDELKKLACSQRMGVLTQPEAIG